MAVYLDDNKGKPVFIERGELSDSFRKMVIIHYIIKKACNGIYQVEQW